VLSLSGIFSQLAKTLVINLILSFKRNLKLRDKFQNESGIDYGCNVPLLTAAFPASLGYPLT